MDTKIYAPVIIPTLNRYDHFKQCLESLEKCIEADKTDVYVGLDFPPSEKYKEGWSHIDDFLRIKEKNNKFKTLIVFRRDHNCGILHSCGNDTMLRKYVQSKYDRWIFSEDDNIFSPNFLVYINKCLEKYNDDNSVLAVSGYTYPVRWKVSEGATCLKQNVCASMWGIGFWKDKYNEAENRINNGYLHKSFNNVIKEKKYLKMIDATKQGYFPITCLLDYKFRNKEKDTWRMMTDFATRCYLAVDDKFIITPVCSKVRNMGFDGSGACCQSIITANGNTAGTYNYNQQIIDESSVFNLIEDKLHDDDGNRDILNAFDYRNPAEMRTVNRLIWISENVGCMAAKTYARIMQPFQLAYSFYKIKIRK